MENLSLQKAVVVTIVTIFITVSFASALSTSNQKETMPLGNKDSRGWYWKPSYPNYAPSGVPDFDQQQDTWKAIEPGPNGVINSVPAGDDFINVTEKRLVPGQNCRLESAVAGDDVAVWAFCGPAAVADCFWWYDSKYSDPTGTPGDGKDNFPLVANYGAGDDHARGNVPLLIERLARAMRTNIRGTTYINDMNTSIRQWLVNTSLANHFTVTKVNNVTFPYVEQQIEISQNVILLVGGYHQDTNKTIDQKQLFSPASIFLPNMLPGHAQSFKPTVNILSAVQLLLQNTLTSPVVVNVSIWNNLPPAPQRLGYSVLPIPGGAPAWYQFHFTPSIGLTPGQTYYIDAYAQVYDNAVRWFYTTNNSYAGGTAWFFNAGPPIHLVQQPSFDFTFKTEYYGGHRVSGHYLTCAGVNSNDSKIAVSDPIHDVQSPTANHTSHNDAKNVSHDIYNVSIGSPYPNLPYQFWLSGYPDAGNFTVVEQALVLCGSDNPPNTPAKPQGTTVGKPNTVYAYTSSTTDPDGDQVYYLFDWGDGTNSSWKGPYASGATASANHSWSSPGNYQVKVKAKDFMQVESSWSASLSVIINGPPNKPEKPSGTINGKPKTEYTYTSTTTDPNGDQIYYLFDWGDGTNSSWVGPYASGATGSAKHAWVKGTYQIKVKAKDTNGAESVWSDPLPVSMPVGLSNRVVKSNLFLLLEWVLYRLPFLEKLLMSFGLFES